MSYGHLLGISNGSEPLTATDMTDLAAVLDVPSVWLRDGFTGTGANS
jgi:hypothetical protein